MKSVEITHPERIVYASAGISKGEVAAYYRAVAPWMLDELAGRPLSLVRCPEGAEGECFFQRHYTDALGPPVKRVSLQQKVGVGDYLYVEDLQGLMALVQMNTLEFQSWGSRVGALERPDRLVFDLDPDHGVEWKRVVAAAREIRARLREWRIESFVRLTGGKGIHVVAPILPGSGWNEAKDFSEALATAMVADRPSDYVATMSKSRRSGRIFVDWLRNTRSATCVCSWSLRAKPGAAVAMPLRWEELGRVDGADAFDLRKSLRRASSLRSSPWSEAASLRQRLPTHPAS